jgi:hypothetical protein
MTETDHSRTGAPDANLDASPFTTPPVEGMPFDRGSEEDAAIRRILERPEPRPSDG